MTIAAPLPALRVPRKRALLIAAQYLQYASLNLALPGTHRDTETAKKLLVEVYDWNEEDITILLDDDDKYLSPTRENIMRSMEDLVKDAQAGDQFVFLFSGHGGQVKDVSGDEKDDGLDEVIWPVDIILKDDDEEYQENYILDDDIRKILVDSLPAETRLVMLFDCCHSGTASDLDCFTADECPAPQVSSQKSTGVILGKTGGKQANYAIKTVVQQDYTEEVDTTIYSPMSRMISKHKTVAVNKPVLPHVTSWSACKDSQMTVENEDGCFIAAFARALRANPNQTHAQLLHSVSEEMEKITNEANRYYMAEKLDFRFTVAKPLLGTLLQMRDSIHSHPVVL